MPCDYSKYPDNWKEIRVAILARAKGCCEGTAQYPGCQATNHQIHPETGSMVVLTIAHLDHDTTNNEPDNLRALCQRCHLTWDAKHHAQTARKTRIDRSGQLTLL